MPADIARLNLRAKALREKGLTHALKKAPGSKKRSKNVGKEGCGSESIEPGSLAKRTPSDEEREREEKKKKKKKMKNGKDQSVAATSIGIKNASTASLTRKVLEEQEHLNKRRKLVQNENVNSLFNKSNSEPKMGNSADYMTRGFSIGKN